MNSIRNENKKSQHDFQEFSQNSIERTYNNRSSAPIINIGYNNNDSQLNYPDLDDLPSLEEIQKSKITMTPNEEEFIDSKNKNPEICIANKSLNDNNFTEQQDYPSFEEVNNSSTPQEDKNYNTQNNINKGFLKSNGIYLFDLIKGPKNNDTSIEKKY